MKKYFLFLPVLSIFLTSCCNRESCMEGTVRNSKTNNPVAGIRLNIAYEYSQEGSLRHSQGEATSGNDGFYSYCTDLDVTQFNVSLSPIQEGYSEVIKRLDDDILLTPLDGVLRLTATNETGMHDSIFIWVFNKCEYEYLRYGGNNFTTPYPLTLQPGGTHTELFSACAGDSTAIQWRFTETGPWVDIDSLLITAGDTAFFNIAY